MGIRETWNCFVDLAQYEMAVNIYKNLASILIL